MVKPIFDQNSINQGSSNRFRLAISNFLDLKPQDVRQYFEAKCKSVSLPNYDLEYIESKFKGTVKLHPVSKNNEDLKEITVTFQLDENFNNYFYLNKFVQLVRYGQAGSEKYIHNLNIDTLDVVWLNNRGVDKRRLRFVNAVVINLSQLELEFGNPEGPLFECSFRYEQILVEDAEDITE